MSCRAKSDDERSLRTQKNNFLCEFGKLWRERGVEEHDDGANDEVIFEFIRIAANYYYLSKHSQLKRHKLDLPKTSA